MKTWTVAVGLVLAGQALTMACRDGDERKKEPPLPVLEPGLVEIPAGWYTAGCAKRIYDPAARDSIVANGSMLDCFVNNPARRLWLSAFAIDRYPVSWGDYAACVAAGACRPGFHTRLRRRPHEPNARERRYVENVAYQSANAYCKWKGKRLPTAWEWEKAARGADDDRIFPWGDAPPDCQQRPGQPLQCEPEELVIGTHPERDAPTGVADLFHSWGEWTSTASCIPVVKDPPAALLDESRQPPALVLDRDSVSFKVFYRAVIDPTQPSYFDPRWLWCVGMGPYTGEKLMDRKGHAGGGVFPSAGIGQRVWSSADDLPPLTEDQEYNGDGGGFGFRCAVSRPSPPPPKVDLPPGPPFRLWHESDLMGTESPVDAGE